MDINADEFKVGILTTLSELLTDEFQGGLLLCRLASIDVP